VQHKAVYRQGSVAVWPVQTAVGQNNNRDQLRLSGSTRESSLSALQQVSDASYPCGPQGLLLRKFPLVHGPI